MRTDEPTRLAVLDASVAVRWLIPEIGSDLAIGLFQRPLSWIAPHLILTEFTSALRRKIAENVLATEGAVQAIDSLQSAISESVLRLARDETLIANALMIALVHRHKVADCVYLALAEQQGASLATADRTLARIASERNIPILFVNST